MSAPKSGWLASAMKKVGVWASTEIFSSRIIRNAVAGSTAAGSTRVAPSSVNEVSEPIPAIVWNGIT